MKRVREDEDERHEIEDLADRVGEEEPGPVEVVGHVADLRRREQGKRPAEHGSAGKDRDHDLDRIGSLSEASRRALYRYVAGSPAEVSREQAAKATRVSRVLAAFHLDRLVKAGLLEASFRRVSGRTGPGAGRPSKLYRRASRSIEISLPEKRYQLLSQLLAGAIERAGDDATRQALDDTAHEVGRRLGTENQTRPGRRALSPREVVRLLDGFGYEPYADGKDVRLRNCPFDSLAAEHRELVCSTNLRIMEGMLQGLGDGGLEAQLDPQPDCCCVVFHQRSA